MTVKFVDTLPGRAVARRGELNEFADELKGNPLVWGVYPREHTNDKSAYSCASAINHDKFPALAGPEFEATARKGSGTVRVYVRYNPDKVVETPEAPEVETPAVTDPVEAAEVAPTPEVATEEPSVSYSYPADQEAAPVS